jgi:hypothetical protein
MNNILFGGANAKANGLSEGFKQRTERTHMREEMLRKQPGHVPARPVSAFLKKAESATAPVVLNKSRR